MPDNTPEKRNKTLLEMCEDIKAHPEMPVDSEGAKAILDGFARDELSRVFGYTLQNNFDDALRYLKEQLRPCPDAFKDVELRRLIGTEIAWQAHINDGKNHCQQTTAEAREKERRDFLGDARFGIEPVLDEDSPTRRLAELETYLRSWRDFPAFGFGIRSLEDATGGILPGEICVLTGAPGTMKTSLALCAMDDFVSRTDEGLVYYCSVDMNPLEITQRIMERESRIPQAVIAGMSAMGDPEYRSIAKGISAKYDGRLVIRGHTSTRLMTIGDLLMRCLKRQPQLIIIDYFTRLKQTGQSDLEFVEDAMPKILQFAHQYQASFLILSQMSRSSRAEQATGRTGGHGKGGGIVEELAHTEIELFQQPVEDDKPMVIAAVTKARRGVSGQFFSLDYDGPIKRFTGKSTRMSKSVQKKAIFAPANDSFYGRASA